ncbi:hypothetical protein [Limnoglobus roseus]|uniref:Uncharacterized protein n=1 Tax=Limnoglobus roseus TaxID=2598579 RepID=A0A5C1AAL8_9BACT|nr:hypothetical protein [Limnoglobus roseus]QEL16261.1 hypothetical protein PX52LOC_03201 [Limnoglobus roseus]
MIRARFLPVLAAALVTAVALAPVPAADPPKADAATQEANAGDVQLLGDAYKLAEFAEKNKSPESYIAAGAMILKLKAVTKGEMGTLDAVPDVLDKDEKPVKGAKADAKKAEGLAEIADGFFESASGLGLATKTSKEVEGLIKAAKARDYTNGEATRGAIGGPKVAIRVLGAYQTHVYTIPFDTYSLAAIGFQATAPLRCKMQIGSVVHFDQTVSVGQYVWKPRQNVAVRTFTIVVSNPRNFPVTYKLFTN